MPLLAAQEAKRRFSIPSGPAVATLQQFVKQAEIQLVYSLDKIDGVQTHPIKGVFTAREVLDRMLVNTGVVVVEDVKTGALMLNRLPRSEKQGPPSESNQPADKPEKKAEKSVKARNAIALLYDSMAVAFCIFSKPGVQV